MKEKHSNIPSGIISSESGAHSNPTFPTQQLFTPIPTHKYIIIFHIYVLGSMGKMEFYFWIIEQKQ